jgi:hypothetical protein
MNEDDRRDGLPSGRFFSDDQTQLPEGKPVNPVAAGCLTYAGLKVGCVLTFFGLIFLARFIDTLLGRHPWSGIDSVTIAAMGIIVSIFLAIRLRATKP